MFSFEKEQLNSKVLEERPSNLNLYFVHESKPKVLHNRSNFLLCTFTTVTEMKGDASCHLIL